MRNELELLVDCLVRLDRLGIPYMLTGSMASNFWGIPRTTHDLDFVVVFDAGQAQAFADAFSSGFIIQVESIRQALQPPYQFNAIDEQSALKVDFWRLRDDVFECHAFERHVQARLFDTPAWIATAEDVILHKLYGHSLNPSDRQLLDAVGVWKVQGSAMDIPYLRKWAQVLKVDSELDKLLSGGYQPKST